MDRLPPLGGQETIAVCYCLNAVGGNTHCFAPVVKYGLRFGIRKNLCSSLAYLTENVSQRLLFSDQCLPLRRLTY